MLAHSDKQTMLSNSTQVEESKINESNKPLVYVSLDADGCVYNNAYRAKVASKWMYGHPKTHQELLDLGIVPPKNYPTDFLGEDVQMVIDSNPLLIEFLTKIQVDYVGCGSNRQSPEFDYSLALQNETARYMSLLPRITDYLVNKTGRSLILDKFLLSDLNLLSKVGSHFDNPQSKDKFPLDHDKLLLLYAQLQRAVALHPDKIIEFFFIDDREAILKNLSLFFADNRDLIPKNVKFNIFQYDGSQSPKKFCDSIKGTGPIDYNYIKNTLKLYVLYEQESCLQDQAQKDQKDEAQKDEDYLNYCNYDSDTSMLLNVNGQCKFAINALHKFKEHLKASRDLVSSTTRDGLSYFYPPKPTISTFSLAVFGLWAKQASAELYSCLPKAVEIFNSCCRKNRTW